MTASFSNSVVVVAIYSLMIGHPYFAFSKMGKVSESPAGETHQLTAGNYHAASQERSPSSS